MLKKNTEYIIVLILFLSSSAGGTGNGNGLIILSNNNIEVGILTEAGGRIVLLRKPGQKNILKSDEQIWENPEKHVPEISAFSEFKAFNGHITWVGPQKEWWIYQTLNEERKKTKADWPPDPYLIYGKNEIISQSDTSIKMVGLESPISGVRLFKEISINRFGKVTITTIAENTRDENISWDLWMLTRMDGFAKAYVPVEENGILELIQKETETVETTPYKIEEKYFTFNPSLPLKPKKEQIQEVHLYPSANYIAGFSERQMLLIRVDKLDQNLIHPNHGLVELYNYTNEKVDDNLLELEVHGAYKTLAPGEMMSLTETWELYHYNGGTNTTNQIKFLKDCL